MIGGRNRPWLLSVETETGIKLFVAKFFSQRDIDQQNALCKEVYASVLANELGLNTPATALITIDDQFRETLPREQQETLKNKHTSYAFGSEFIDGTFTFSPSQHITELADYDIESVFAFDVLILNTDRRKRKPNILLDDKQYYLIDHEHTLLLPMHGVQPKKQMATYRFDNHIFYNALHRKATYGNQPEFATFIEHFRRLNCDVLDSYGFTLSNKGYETGDSLVIKQYLEKLKRDITYFIHIVKGGVQ